MSMGRKSIRRISLAPHDQMLELREGGVLFYAFTEEVTIMKTLKKDC